ncbi:MAG: hypothetical protein K2H01_09375 [Ruminococcus sp.]|nr:hypothetical protein [Ruminococcus sp.]
MENLSALEIKYIKKIKKHSGKISPEQVSEILGTHAEYILKSLREKAFVDRNPDKGDRIEMLMDFGEDHVVDFHGEWVLTEKAYAFLEGHFLSMKLKFLSGFFGFILGVISTILAEYVVNLIVK